MKSFDEKIMKISQRRILRGNGYIFRRNAVKETEMFWQIIKLPMFCSSID